MALRSSELRSFANTSLAFPRGSSRLVPSSLSSHSSRNLDTRSTSTLRARKSRQRFAGKPRPRSLFEAVQTFFQNSNPFWSSFRTSPSFPSFLLPLSPTMAASPLNIDTKRLPLTPQWSPILSHSRSPSLTSPRSSEDLSSRCRKLARSFGESALVDDFEQASPKSPSRSRENSNEGGLPPSPLSPDRGQRHFHLPLSPPHPEGAHELNEILEEENESTPQQERMEEERGLGFESDVQTEGGEPIQFRLSPMIGNHLSLHEAGIAMRGDAHMGGVGGEGALGLTLHDRLRMDNQEYR